MEPLHFFDTLRAIPQYHGDTKDDIANRFRVHVQALPNYSASEKEFLYASLMRELSMHAPWLQLRNPTYAVQHDPSKSIEQLYREVASQFGPEHDQTRYEHQLRLYHQRLAYNARLRRENSFFSGSGASNTQPR
jgi:hypothetical protein